MKGILIDAIEKQIQYVDLPAGNNLFNADIKKHLRSGSISFATSGNERRAIFSDQNCLANPAIPAFIFKATRQVLFGRVLLTGWNTIANSPTQLDDELDLEKVKATVTFLNSKESREAWARENKTAYSLFTNLN